MREISVVLRVVFELAGELAGLTGMALGGVLMGMWENVNFNENEDE